MPDWRQHVRKNLRGSGLTGEREAEVAEELAQQLEDAYRDALAQGMGEEEAARRARAEVDDWQALAREVLAVEHSFAGTLPSQWVRRLETRRPPLQSWFGDIAGDFRHVLRGLARRRAFATAAVLALALGIGANTAIFSVIYGSWLSPLPFPEEDRLVRIFLREDDRPLPISTADFLDLKRASQGIEKMAAHTSSGVLLSTGSEWSLTPAATVTFDFFDVLGVPMQLGRSFEAEDAAEGAGPVVILTYPLWQQRFGGDPEIIGRAIQTSDARYTVVGVTSPSFFSRRSPYDPGEARLYLPFQWNASSRENRSMRWIFPIGRLKKEVSKAAAAQELKQLFRGLSERYDPGRLEKGTTIDLDDFRSWTVAEDKSSLLMLSGAALLVLLIACVNVANLLLVRFESVASEITIRAALGAGRWRLARIFMSESLALTGLACAVGILIASWGVSLLVKVWLEALPRASQIGLQWPVLLFSLALSLGTALLIGLVPVWRLRLDRLSDDLKGGQRANSLAQSRFRDGLAVAQIALTIMLVAGAGLLLHSLWNLNKVDLGVDLENVVTFKLTLPDSGYHQPAAIQRFYRDLVEKLEGSRGIKHAGWVLNTPFEQKYSSSFSPADDPHHRVPLVPVRMASPGFFKAVGIPLIAGRIFGPSPSDGPQSQPAAAVVSLSLAQKLFPSGQALGKRIVADKSDLEVIGIVGDVREFGPAADNTPSVYLPARQLMRTMTVVVRTTEGFREAAPLIRQAVDALEPKAAVWEIESLREQAYATLQERRLALSLVALFAAMALALAAVGVFGVIASMVASGTREIGIRLALGARPATIMLRVLQKGAFLVAIGIPVGVGGAAALGRALGSLLWEVSPFDPATLLVVVAVVLLTMLSACLVPARRAARVDPLKALRCE